MAPSNPLKPIQEALERVLHDSGLHDFGRSMSSIDDLTAEVQHVYQRVDDIERVLETIVPILERLTVVFEDIQSDLEPMSELASKIPGSGSRRRRREKEAAALQGSAALGSGSASALAPQTHGPRGPAASGTGRPSPGAGPSGEAQDEGHPWTDDARAGVAQAGPAWAGSAKDGSTRAGAPPASNGQPGGPRSDVPGSGARQGAGTAADAPGTPPAGGGNVRPGATGYSPLGSRDRLDR